MVTVAVCNLLSERAIEVGTEVKAFVKELEVETESNIGVGVTDVHLVVVRDLSVAVTVIENHVTGHCLRHDFVTVSIDI